MKNVTAQEAMTSLMVNSRVGIKSTGETPKAKNSVRSAFFSEVNRQQVNSSKFQKLAEDSYSDAPNRQMDYSHSGHDSSELYPNAVTIANSLRDQLGVSGIHVRIDQIRSTSSTTVNPVDMFYVEIPAGLAGDRRSGFELGLSAVKSAMKNATGLTNLTYAGTVPSTMGGMEDEAHAFALPVSDYYA